MDKKTELEGKLALLKVTCEETSEILQSKNQDSIERQLKDIRAYRSECETLKRDIQLANATSTSITEEEQRLFSKDVRGKLESADEACEEIVRWFTDRKQTRDQQEREVRDREFFEREKLKDEMQRKRLEEKLELELDAVNKKFELEQKLLNTKVKEQTESKPMAKMPRLQIAEFSGEPLDWLRFWRLFTTNVDSREISASDKMSYLLGYLSENVRDCIVGLDFDKKGYKTAKEILVRKYGDMDIVTNAYVDQIADLPEVRGTNVKKIGEFYTVLSKSVKALSSMGKISIVQGLVVRTLQKLPAIMGDLVRNDSEWLKWDFDKLEQELEQWLKRNKPVTKVSEPLTPSLPVRKPEKPKRAFSALSKGGCVYCGEGHKSVDCTKIPDAKGRKKFLTDEQRCYNCTSKLHKSSSCTSKGTCVRCNERHHSSLHDLYNKPSGHVTETPTAGKITMTTVQAADTIHPVVVVKVNGIMCRALLDSGSSCSYVSAHVAGLFDIAPSRKFDTTIEMLMTERHVSLDVYGVQVESLKGDFSMNVELMKLNRTVLFFQDNPRYEELCKFSHLKSVVMDDVDTKAKLPVHLVLGGGEFAKIKTATCPLMGEVGEPVAELTKLGWTIMSPGQKFDRNHMLFTQTTSKDYEELCRLDVLGLADRPEHDQAQVYEEFHEQLTRSPEGWYLTGLPWRGSHPPLPDNRQGAERRLEQLERKLAKQGLREPYECVIQEQLAAGIVEPAPDQTAEKVCYLPHRPVCRETAESTKLRVVYDASARATVHSPSLNDCLNPGPPLQNRLLDVLIRNRAHPIALCADVKQAFLQIRIRKEERDVLRFLWDGRCFRFTRALFGLTSSPFLLNGVLKEHFHTWAPKEPEAVAELEQSTYVDDVLSGGTDIDEVKTLKSTTKVIFADAGFTLHKWNSNIPELEDCAPASEELTYAKDQLRVGPHETKLLGLPWDKQQDTLTVTFPTTEATRTKRGLLSQTARIYDPLGLSTPRTLGGKLLYREVCEKKISWDTVLEPTLIAQWVKWERSLPPLGDTVPRAFVRFCEPITEIELHAFGDASRLGVGGAIYAVTHQPSGVTTQLVAAKGRLAKEDLSIPRLELVGAHMASNLLANVRSALSGVATITVQGWLDSTVVLYWLKGAGQCKQFVANRVAKIQQHADVTWRYVPSNQNPADIASRGGEPDDLWWCGPPWLPHPELWPPNPTVSESPESEQETKPPCMTLCIGKATLEADCFDLLLERLPLHKALRCLAWIWRLAFRFRLKVKRTGPLTTEELEHAECWWVLRVQSRLTESDIEAVSDLGLEKNDAGLLECHGRIEGNYPIYLPDDDPFTVKLVERAHIRTLHGGVTATMTRVRDQYWVPRLRRLTKRVRAACHKCKRFRAKAFTPASTATLPVTRTEGSTPYQVIGVDFAGPIRYKHGSQEGKAYLALFACSLTRGVHLELLHSLETNEFLKVLKRFIARRGRPSIIYSDNGATFKAAADWIHKVRRDEAFNDALARLEIKWKFNLAKAPWWGGQFERLIGVFKTTFYKVIGNAKLSYDELEETVLDVEVAMNGRPLCYVEDDVAFPVLTPSTFLFQAPNALPELPAHLHDATLRQRARFLLRVKDALWSRWTREYLNALREHHRIHLKPDQHYPALGEVLLIKGDSPNRGKWLMGKVTRLVVGRDGETRGAVLQTVNGQIQRPLRELFPLELHADVQKDGGADPGLNVEAKEFRPRRAAAVDAARRIQDLAQNE